MIEPLPPALERLSRKLPRRACHALNVALEFHGVDLVVRALDFERTAEAKEVRLPLIMAMRRDGLTNGQIAMMLGVENVAVHNAIYFERMRSVRTGWTPAKQIKGPSISRALAETKASNRARIGGAA